MNNFSDHKKFSMFRKRADETIAAKDKEIKKLKGLIDCKHMRVSSIRTDKGFKCCCLNCGDLWFKKDKPLTDEEKAKKLIFDNWENHNVWRDNQGLKPAGCE